MASFLAALWDPADAAAEAAAEQIRCELGDEPGQCLEGSGFLVADLSADDPDIARLLPLGTRGAIFGTLFRSSAAFEPAAALTCLSATEVHAITGLPGRTLLTRYWGNYVAFVCSKTGIEVHADPSVSIPCFYMRRSHLTVLFSHLERCPQSLRRDLTLNREFILKLLAYDKIQNGETGLNEIRELCSGYCLSIDRAGTHQCLVWDPRDIAGTVRKRPGTQAARELYQVTEYVVQSWGACFRNLSLDLSGGLDSAVVAAFLARRCGSGDIHARHFILKGGDPSETRYARSVATYLGIPLEDVTVDPCTPLPAPELCPLSVRPYREFLGLDRTRLMQDRARGSPGPTFTGQGGDHLFLESRNPLGFADFLLNEGMTGRTVRELLSAARLSEHSVWQTLIEAIGAIAHGRQDSSGTFEAISSRQTVVNQLAGPGLDAESLLPGWAGSAKGTAPAKFAQITSLVHLFQIRSALASTGTHAFVHPLVSRPLIEHCLATPVYDLCPDGWPRGLIRSAMKGEIPENVRLRRSKGDASRFYIEQLNANSELLAGTLQDGELVAGGYVRREDLDAFMKPEAFRTQTFGRMLLVYYVIECWLRRWKSELTGT